MKRKVFVSFLGTTAYVETHYKFPDGYESPVVRFVQEALVRKVCAEWTKDDLILILVTEKSRESNWVDKIDETNNSLILGLESCLRNTHLKPDIRAIEIKEGFDQNDIWDIFKKVNENIKDYDLIYFDITNSLRHIPMFGMVLFNYSQFMNNTQLASVVYGAFEAMGPIKDLPKNPDDRKAPIIDLTGLIRLQHLTEVASEIHSFGRVKSLRKSLETLEIEAKLKPFIKGLSNALEDFENDIHISRITEIRKGNNIKKIYDNIKHLEKKEKEDALPAPIKEVFQRILNEFKFYGFVRENSDKNIEAAIKWCAHYKMLPQAYTMAQEYIITLFQEHYNEDNPYVKDKKNKYRDYRRFVSGILNMEDEKYEQELEREPFSEYPELTKKLFNASSQLRALYPNLRDNRNTVNHGKSSAKTYEALEKEFNDSYTQCLEAVKQIIDNDKNTDFFTK